MVTARMSLRQGVDLRANERTFQISCQNKVRTAEDSNEAFGQTAPADPGPSAINDCSSSELGGRPAAAPARALVDK